MLYFGYSPFLDGEGKSKNIFQVEFDDLEQLRDKEIEEGMFIEYKRELSPSVKKKIPNIIGSFANEKDQLIKVKGLVDYFFCFSIPKIGYCKLRAISLLLQMNPR